MNLTAEKIQNLSNAKALRRAREFKGLTRKELALLLEVTPKAIEKYENGRYLISENQLLRILEVLEISKERFKKIKKGKGLNKRERVKKVNVNSDRRSYQKIITKECQVLKSLRRMKGLSQYKASELCGYPNASIGHIENGRIELTKERIVHILKSYEYDYSKFEECISKEVQRDDIVDSCIKKIKELDDEKLGLVKGILGSL
jgi:transcriptional regulator with XRE-family HTH domain